MPRYMTDQVKCHAIPFVTLMMSYVHECREKLMFIIWKNYYLLFEYCLSMYICTVQYIKLHSETAGSN